MQDSTRSTQKFFYHLSAMLVLAILAAPVASAQSTFATIHEFTGTDGALPVGNLVSDSAGNLYGVAAVGGEQDTKGCFFTAGYCGSVFKLAKSSVGVWQRTVLYRFSGGSDGGNPFAGLVIDSNGNLYGTTVWGGLGHGVVFELSPTATGVWVETVLYGFQGGNDGYYPEGSLVFDAAGNLYGTTYGGGTGLCGFAVTCGTVFELSRNSNGGWNETVIYNFNSVSDGAFPQVGMIFDPHGNLYGTTAAGGNTSNTYCGYPYYGCGTVFELSPSSAGGWTKTTLYTFSDGPDGASPDAGLIFDAAGSLYGTAAGGGDINGCNYFGCGVVFKLSPNSAAGWTETVLHAFKSNGSNIGAGGGAPIASLVFDSAHNLYGTASQGGSLGAGVVFKLSHSPSKSWQETLLHAFSGPDGAGPASGLLLDSAGTLIGTTTYGGVFNAGNACADTSCGVVFEIKP
jgi:hypothetical protein